MRVLVQTYTFNKSTKQVTFTDYVSISLEKVLVVTDVTNNTTIYQANDPAKGGSVSGNVLTLAYDTTGAGFSNSDKLQIFYEPDADIVSVSSSALPTGAATSALQSSGNSSLSSIDTKTPSLTSGRVPVDGSGVTQPVSGTVSVGNFPSTQAVSGTVSIEGGNSSAVKVDGSAVTQPVSASSLPLPSGAATESTLSQVLTAIQGQIDIASTLWTDDSGAYYVRRDLVDESDGSISVTFVDPSGSSATPGAGLRPVASADKEVISEFFNATGSGTGYSSGDLLARVAIIAVEGSSPSASFIWLNLTSGSVISAPSSANVSITNSTVLAAQSGTWNINNVSGTVSLPTGAATSAKQPALGTSGSPSSDVITVQGASGMTALKVDGSNVTQPVSGTVTANVQGGNSTAVKVDGSAVTQPVSGSISVSNFPATQPVSGTVTANVQGGNSTAVKVDGSAVTQPVSASSLPLPTGAATSAKQPALGVAGTPAADVITVQGATSMTALKVDGSAVTQPVSGTITANVEGGNTAAVKVDGSAVTQPVSGTVTANAGTGSFTVAQATAANLNASVTQSGTWNINNVSGTVSLPSGAATSAKQPALGSAGTPSADVITVQGATSMTALKVDGSAVTQPVSGTVTANVQGGNATAVKVDGSAVTQPVSGSITVSGTVTANLGTIDGAATETTLSSINTKIPALGQTTKSGSTPVAIASDQTLPITEDRGFVSTSNSTTAPLAISATYTGTWEEVTQYASLTVIASTDQVGTLYIDFSTDSTNVDRTIQLSDMASNPSGVHASIPVARYFRVRLVNDGVAQTTLRIQTVLNRGARIALPTSRMSTALTEYSDVLNTRAAIVGKYNVAPPILTDGQRTDIQLDVNGRLVTSQVSDVRQTSTAALSGSATFTSQTFDTVNGQDFISWSIFSVTDLLVHIEESSDGTNWSVINSDAVSAGTGNDQSHKVSSRYARVRVVNGITANAGGVSNLYIATALSVNGTQPDVRLADQFGNRITADTSWGLRVKTPQDTDIFGAGVSHVRVSQINANFSQPLANNDVTSTTSGGGTTTQANGSLSITSGTGTTASAKLTTNTVIAYAPGREAYAVFTAAFTTPTSAATNQRIGLYDTSNGFFIGYEGTTFGVTQRQNGVDTFIAKASFNEDALTGNVHSFFTRGGAAEAIDLTKKNIYRIRFGWLGAATIRFEVMSPDGRWVRFHSIRFPNTSVAPSIYSTAIPIGAEVNKTAADATSLTISSSSWDGGIVDAPNADLDYTGTIAAAQGAVTSQTRGKATISFNLTGTWSGTLVIEGHNGDSSWSAVTGYTSAGAPVTSITTNSFFFVNCAAYNQIRLRASAWTSGTVTAQTTATIAQVSVFTQTEGNSAAGATDTGNPLKIGGLAKTAQPTAVTDGQRSNILTDKLGRVVVAPGHIRDLVTNATTAITGTAETTVVAAVAATFNDLSTLVITNAANQATVVTVRDTTGGTIRSVFNLAASGGIVLNLPVPWKQTTVNTNWTVQQTGAGTINVFAIAVQNI